MEIGVSPQALGITPASNRVTIDTAALAIVFTDSADIGCALRDGECAERALRSVLTGGVEVQVERSATSVVVRLIACTEDGDLDEAIETFADFVTCTWGARTLQRALARDSVTVERTLTNREKAVRAQAQNKVEIARLIAKLQAQVAAMPDDSAKWANVGDSGHVVAQLTELTSTFQVVS